MSGVLKAPAETRPYRIALAGNPNSGKTSVFNALTGARQKVGNYPGVTVERRVGSYKRDDVDFEVMDLPGTYGLNTKSPEERIAQKEILEGHFDLIVVVVDSTALRRSLGLLSQVMLADLPTLLVLNMSDEADASGQKLDIKMMSKLLDVPIVRTVGHKAEGIKTLKDEVASLVQLEGASKSPSRHVVYGDLLTNAIDDLASSLTALKSDLVASRWLALRLLANDMAALRGSQELGALPEGVLEKAESWRVKIEAESGRDIDLYIAECQAGFASGLLQEVVIEPARDDARSFTGRVDSILVHRVWGLPIFAAIMYAVFWVTFTVGEYPMGWIESGQEWLADVVSGWWAEGTESALRSLLVDGIIGGVGAVVIFLPNILLLFVGVTILEATGYMARAAFLMDRLMHKFGLHGKSFVPMMTGFGCSIPGIMATRTLEDEKDRLATMMVLPLMSCGARLSIWMLIIPAIFAPAWRAPMLFFIYAAGVVVALLLALVLRKSLLKGEDSPFVMELPPYRMPTMRALVSRVAERGWIYLKKAGTIILAFAVILWAATAYPQKEVFDVDAQLEAGEIQMEGDALNDHLEEARATEALRYSVAGRIGTALEPVMQPIGMDWKGSTAVIGAFAAKEVFVSQMGIVYSMGEVDEESESLRGAIARDYTPLSAIAIMLFLLISTPCMATVAITKRESGKWSWALLQFFGLTGVGYLVALLVYQIGGLFM